MLLNKMAIVRMIACLTSESCKKIQHMDVNNVIPYDMLDAIVIMKQQGIQKLVRDHLGCKLKNSMYGLRQA